MLFRKKEEKDVVDAYKESYKKVMDALYKCNAVSAEEMNKMLDQNAAICAYYRQLERK